MLHIAYTHIIQMTETAGRGRSAAGTERTGKVWLGRPVARAFAGLAASLVAASGAYGGEAVLMRREPSLRFDVDEAFQADGGVQYFYELTTANRSAAAASQSLPLFLAFAVGGRQAARTEPLSVVATRVVHTIDKDSSFFTEERAKDVAYLNTVAPGLGIVRVAPDTYRVAATPSNLFRLRWLDADAVRRGAHTQGLSRLLELTAGAALPESVVVQENREFARVMGFRTGDASVTWTAHYPLRPGQTRICIFSMSTLYNLPPKFLGGEERVYSETVNAIAGLIRNLRAYPAR